MALFREGARWNCVVQGSLLGWSIFWVGPPLDASWHTELYTYIDVVQQSLLGGGASLGLIIKSKANGDLVVKD